MTIAEKIADTKAKIATSQARISNEQEKIATLRRKLDTLESLEVKAILKEIDLPMEQVVELLKTMKPTPTVNPEQSIREEEQAQV